MLFPKLKEMGIIKGALKDPDELKILNRIGSLFYRDIRPSLGNSSDMSGREFYDIDDEGNPINESDTQRIVKRVLNEQEYMDSEQLADLHDIHDDILYLTPEYSHEDESIKNARAIGIFQHLLNIIGENGTVSKEADELINRINFDISGLLGLSDRVVRLYTTLTEEQL